MHRCKIHILVILLAIAILSFYATIPEELGSYLGGYTYRSLGHEYAFYLFIVSYCIVLATPLLYLIAGTLIRRLEDRGLKLTVHTFVIGLLLTPLLIGIPLAAIAYIVIVMKIVNKTGVEHLQNQSTYTSTK